MCLQCMTKAKMLVKNVLPGYHLMRATVGHAEWSEGYYGLVQCNDPDFVWKGKPQIDPLIHLTDKQMKELFDNDPIWDKSNKFFTLVESIEKFFIAEPIMGYQLVRACKKAGYNEKKHGLRIMCWLIHHMAIELKKRHL